MTSEKNRRDIALEFLRRLRTGDATGAEQLVAPGARHHNPYFPAGMSALITAAAGAARTAPDRTSETKLALEDGDYVVVHSHVIHQPGQPGASVVHIFRFDGLRIAELWDVGQPIPAENPNRDGMF